jgi:DNA-binding HxlR family transcriptional regulator
VLREILPPELHHQLTDLVRQLLVLLRALIDWAVTRLEQEGPGREPEVEDIRID